MRGYTQLARDERYQIYALRKAGHSQKEIAEVLRRNPSTISRGTGTEQGIERLPSRTGPQAGAESQEGARPNADTGINLGTCGAVASGGLEPGADQRLADAGGRRIGQP